ncbi:hypothetical protein Tco_1328016 [Tanacetum coccineum]
MKDVFVSVEKDLDETFKQNELLKDQLLEASLAEDIKNLVITSCVEIRNKDLHDETKRISKESKDISNKSKTADTVCNNAFEVTQELYVQDDTCECGSDGEENPSDGIDSRVCMGFEKVWDKFMDWGMESVMKIVNAARYMLVLMSLEVSTVTRVSTARVYGC